MALRRMVRNGPPYGGFLLSLLLLWVTPAAMSGATGTAVRQPPAQAVASAHPLATQAGLSVLDAGGNAFDAAVAVSAALAVVEPYSSGIGGGGFWLLHRAADGRQVMIDGRERAPLAAHRRLYQDAEGEVVPRKSMDGALAAAIPGEPAALAHLAENYGRLPLSRSLQPAIRLAEQGFAVDSHYRRMAGFRLDVLQQHLDSAEIFLSGDQVPAEGFVVRQPDLAATLRALARDGRSGFYGGDVGARLVAGVRAAGGIWTQKDLDEYRVVERVPVSFDYRDLHIVSAAPPSSGGLALATMLHILQGYPLDAFGPATRVHLVTEAMRRAYRDRAEYLGDPDFVEVPVQRLLSPYYADGLRASIRIDRATPSAMLPGPSTATAEATHTTHFSILDREGNRVAATLSINYPFGSGFVAPGTGVLLNDEMDDFSAKPGAPNAYGLVGAQANAIAPGKRPLSSMTPTFVESDNGLAILGTPGGSRIITMVLLGILDLERGHGPASWVSRPRFHHQYLPDVIQYEPGAFSDDVATELRKLGHTLQPLKSDYGNMQAIYWDYASDRVEAASDPRGIGQASVEAPGGAADAQRWQTAQ